MSERVTYRCEAGVARITMDDGKVNAISTAMLADLDAALDRAEADAAIVVLRSSRPGIFSAGFDLKVMAAGDPDASLKMVRGGAALALRLMGFPQPTIGVMEGHAYPMGTFLLLACDLRIGALGPHRMGLNEVAIGITPPGFAIELTRSRVHPSYLSRTVTLGEMFEPGLAADAGFLDRAVAPEAVDQAIDEAVGAFKGVDRAMHAAAKLALRRGAMTAMREAVERELTPDAYRSSAERMQRVVQPGAAR
jgi:enoyl-CoA hydratase